MDYRQHKLTIIRALAPLTYSSTENKLFLKAESVSFTLTFNTPNETARLQANRVPERLKGTRKVLVDAYRAYNLEGLTDAFLKRVENYIERVLAAQPKESTPTPKPIDWTKPLETKRGWPARLVTKDRVMKKAGLNHSHLVLVTTPRGNEHSMAYLPNGKSEFQNRDDWLQNKVEVVKKYARLVSGGHITCAYSRKDHNKVVTRFPVSTVGEVEYVFENDRLVKTNIKYFN